jgi:hypothetical protein
MKGNNDDKPLCCTDMLQRSRWKNVKTFNLRDLPEEENRIASMVVDAAYTVHKEMGPGLLESIYESCLAKEPAECLF